MSLRIILIVGGLALITLLITAPLTYKTFQAFHLFPSNIGFNSTRLNSNLVPITLNTGLITFEIHSAVPPSFQLYQNLINLLEPETVSIGMNCTLGKYIGLYTYNLTSDYYGFNGTGQLITPINFTTWSQQNKFTYFFKVKRCPANQPITNTGLNWYYSKYQGFYVLGNTTFVNDKVLYRIVGSETFSSQAYNSLNTQYSIVFFFTLLSALALFGAKTFLLAYCKPKPT